MIFELIIIVLLYIIIKDLQLIKMDILSIQTTGKSTRKPLFNPNDMFSMLNNSLQALNNELKLNINNVPQKHTMHIEVD